MVEEVAKAVAIFFDFVRIGGRSEREGRDFLEKIGGGG